MIKIKHIGAKELLAQKHLFDAYAKESKNDLVPEHHPSDELYLAMEKENKIKVFGAYDGKELIGFLSVVYTPMPHYNTLSGQVESFFVLKEHRKFGTGQRLLKAAEKQAKLMGCTNLFFSAPVGGDLSKAAKLFGYTNTSLVFMKELV
jgi:GNAT superfamily N-acetyltransferase